MKLTEAQAKMILSDFSHFDGSGIKIKDGQVGQYPVVIILPFDEEHYNKCVMDIYDRMKSGTKLISEYPSTNGEYEIEVFHRDVIPRDTIAKHTDFEKWLGTLDIHFDFEKYGLIRPNDNTQLRNPGTE